jgi:hypothetical protein
MNPAYTHAEAITLIVWAPVALGFLMALAIAIVDFHRTRRNRT